MKPGIFDPWRQNSPPPAKDKKVKEVVQETDPEGAIDFSHAVIFNGVQRGLSIWITPTNTQTDVQIAQEKLVKLLGMLFTLCPDILEENGLVTDITCAGMLLNLPEYPVIARIERDDTPAQRAIDTIANALGNVIRYVPKARYIIEETRIKPFMRSK